MTDVRASDLSAGDAFSEQGMDDVILIDRVGSHGDTVLVWGENGEEVALDTDTVVELVGRREQREFNVSWQIDLMAVSPKEAAREALRIQRDATSLATTFVVNGEEVDLGA